MQVVLFLGVFLTFKSSNLSLELHNEEKFTLLDFETIHEVSLRGV